MELKTPRSGSHQSPHTTRQATKSPRHQIQRVVEYWRTKNKHDPDKTQTRMLDPRPVPSLHTIHPNRHVPATSTIPQQNRQQRRIHPRPYRTRKRLLERHGSRQPQNIQVSRHMHSGRRIQPRRHQNHGCGLLHPKRTTLEQTGPP